MSFIPSQFNIDEQYLTFSRWPKLKLERPPSNGVYHIKNKAKLSGGKVINTRYRVHISSKLKGTVTMTASGFKTMGPVTFKCFKSLPPTDLESRKQCKNNPRQCTDEHLCGFAISVKTMTWKTTGYYRKFVKEAKNRGLSCKAT